MKNETKKGILTSKKHQVFFSFVLLGLMLFSAYFVSVDDGKIASFFSRITSSWVAGNEDIGKIKFVTSEDIIEASGSMFEIKFSMPFAGGNLIQNEDGTIYAQGNGEVMVVCAYPSTVKSIEEIDGKRKVVFACGYGVTVVYYNLDNIGVKVGNKLKRDAAVGVCNDSLMRIEVLHKGKPIKNLKVKNGSLSLG